MSGIVGGLNTRGSGVVAKLGTDGQVFTSAGAGVSQTYEAVAGGKTLGVTQYVDSTRAVITGTTSAITIMSGSYTQIKANSKLKIDTQIQGFPGGAEAGNWHFIYDGSSTLNYMGHEYTASHFMHFTGLLLVDGASSTGSKSWSITWHTDNSSSNRPFGVLNPNATDSALASQHSSRNIITELDL